jgi:hypothetical protein
LCPPVVLFSQMGVSRLARRRRAPERVLVYSRLSGEGDLPDLDAPA